MLAVGVQGAFYALLTWLPQFLQAERKIPLLGSLTYLSAVIVGHFFGLIIGGWLADRLGRRAVLFIFAAVSAVTLYAYMQLPLSSVQMFLLGIPLGFCPGGFYPALMSCLNESYSTLCRGQGVGFCYSFGRAVGGTFPVLVGAATASLSLGTAISVFAIGSYALIAVIAGLMKESNGSILSS